MSLQRGGNPGKWDWKFFEKERGGKTATAETDFNRTHVSPLFANPILYM